MMVSGQFDTCKIMFWCLSHGKRFYGANGGRFVKQLECGMKKDFWGPTTVEMILKVLSHQNNVSWLAVLKTRFNHLQSSSANLLQLRFIEEFATLTNVFFESAHLEDGFLRMGNPFSRRDGSCIYNRITKPKDDCKKCKLVCSDKSKNEKRDLKKSDVLWGRSVGLSVTKYK